MACSAEVARSRNHAVDLPDEECELVQTVGDRYRLVLEKLALPYIPSVEIETNAMGVKRPLSKGVQLGSWTTPDVWVTLQALICHELGVEPNQITEAAVFVDDLGCE